MRHERDEANVGSVLLRWRRRRRRERLLQTPFPASWRELVERHVAHARYLNATERSRLERLIQIFVGEMRFVGGGGLSITDEIRVTVAANACLLLLGLPRDGYDGVRTIIVYPSTVVRPTIERPLFDTSVHVVGPEPALLGEAHLRGPVLLVWDAVRRDSRHPERGHNVVFHEFAHKLDMLDDVVDGTPPLRGREQYARWSRVCGEVYFALRKRVDAGESTFFDPYAATSEGEFFAVATELFFDQPHALDAAYPQLYALLRDYYRQDPALRLPI